MRLSIALYSALALFASNAQAVVSPPSYTKSPVFFEMNRDGYVDSVNADLLPQGKVELVPFGIQNVRVFDWRKHARTDRSWWLRIERFDYLLSSIESDDELHRRTAAKWFMSWYDAHKDGRSPNEGAWEGMIAGYRAMVLVRYLKIEERRKPPAPILDQLRSAIREHQEFLADIRSFERNSNHGMWNVIGLFETTRVFPNDEYTATALERLTDLTRRSVSKKGIHREHSPSYHFAFMNLLDEYARYLGSLDGWNWDGMSELVDFRDSMERASFYLFDHKGRIPKIGDSGGWLDEELRESIDTSNNPWWFYDPVAGFAIVKDGPPSTRKRYLVFNIQNANNETTLVYHFHRDATAVYYSDDGEIILSDQGRYSYARSRMRDYFVSPAAHNAIFPIEFIEYSSGAPYFANRAWIDKGDEGVTFGVTAFGRHLTRTVEIPENGDYFVVNDKILGDERFVALWNLGPDVAKSENVRPGTAQEGEQRFRWILTTKRNRRFSIDITIKGNALPDVDTLRKVRGSKDPALGWYATGFETGVKSDVLRLDLSPLGVLQMTTRVEKLDS